MSEIRMTEELRKQLAGFLPFSKDATADFIPEMYLKKKAVWDKEKGEFVDTDEDCVPSEFRPTFTVRAFNKAEYDKSKKLLAEYRNEKDDAKKLEIESQMKALLQPVVMGWKNLLDIGKMQLVEFKADPAGGCDKALFENLLEGTLRDILEYVNMLSGVTPGERLSLK
jgi:hypothetical protein